MLRESIKLCDVTVESAKRKTNSGNDLKNGVIVAKFRNEGTNIR